MICYDLDNIDLPAYDDKHIKADESIIDLLCRMIHNQNETIKQQKITNHILMECYDFEVDDNDIET